MKVCPRTHEPIRLSRPLRKCAGSIERSIARAAIPSLATTFGYLSGGENQMNVAASRRHSDISSTTGSAGPLSPGERRGAGDKGVTRRVA